MKTTTILQEKFFVGSKIKYKCSPQIAFSRNLVFFLEGALKLPQLSANESWTMEHIGPKCVKGGIQRCR